MKLSIIIPVYNSEEYIEKCLKSIFKQSYQDFEVIVVDAYSKDKTKKILDEYSKHFPRRLHLAFRKPQGEPDAINAGMELAVGDIVAYIDSDDTYEPRCFERVVKAFERNPDASWLYGRGKVIDEKGHECRGIVTAIKELFWPRYSYRTLQCFNYIVQPTVFMRKTFYNTVGRFNTRFKYDFDYEYWLRAGMFSPPFFLNRHLANWRAHSESISVKEYKAEARQVLEIQKEYSEWWMRPIQWKICGLIVLLYWIMRK